MTDTDDQVNTTPNEDDAQCKPLRSGRRIGATSPSRNVAKQGWLKVVRVDDGTTRTAPNANYGKGKRSRARYVDNEGCERAKGFIRKIDAQRWLDSEVTAKFATGTYVAPSAGRVTVADVYQSWFRAQAHISAKTAASRRSA
jgi:hypothetical protein